MKTSNKILITTAGVLIAIMIVGLIALRKEVQAMLTEAQLKYNYDAIPVDDFEGLDFSANWTVKIRQGREYKVEVAADGLLKPHVENIQGTLYFKTDTINATGGAGNLYAKVTVPSLKILRAEGETKIEMRRFQSDSLTIILENNSVFTGDNNKINYASYKTSGEAWLEIIDNEME